MSLPLLHAGRTNPGLSAALDLRFALDKSLTAYRGPTPSFSRASTGSYFDGSGVLRYAALNLLTYSEDFTNGVWLKTNSSISSNVATSPTGTLTADKLVENTAGPTTHVVSYNSATTGTLFSVYAKAGERGWMALQQSNPGRYCYFDLVNGVVGTASGATGSISSAGNGWYRCSILVPSGSSLWDIFVSPSDNGAGYTGNGTSGIFIWGAQLEASSTVGTYCPTTSSANSAPRFNHTFNGTSWVSRGLLVEEQRTNLSQMSEDFSNAFYTKFDSSISANAIAAPDGSTTADKLVENTANAIHYFSSSGYMTTNQTYTVSIFAKAAERNWVKVFIWNGVSSLGAWFNLSSGTIGTTESGITSSIQNVGNGWYRCSITRAVSSGLIENGSGVMLAAAGNSVTYTGDGSSGVYVWGNQVEAGSFSTSYIGTTSSSVTRSADVCQITGSDFSGFWNQNEGSIVAEFSRPMIGTASGDSMIYITAGTGAPSNVQNGAYITSGNITIYGYDSAFTYNFNHGSQSENTVYKVATAIKTNDFASSINGSAVLTDSSGTVGTNERLMIGHLDWGGGNRLNGHIARLRYYRKRLPNATLQQLST